jgi:hypothetical protein
LYDHINLKAMDTLRGLGYGKKKLALDLRRKAYAVWFN